MTSPWLPRYRSLRAKTLVHSIFFLFIIPFLCLSPPTHAVSNDYLYNNFTSFAELEADHVDPFSQNNIIFYDPTENACDSNTTNQSCADVSGDQITWIGDSYSVGAEQSGNLITSAFPGVDLGPSIDNADSNIMVSKNFGGTNGSNPTGAQILERLKNEGKLRRIVVFALGTNDMGGSQAESQSKIDKILEIAGNETKIIFVNAKTPKNSYAGYAAALKATKEAHSEQVFIADWAAVAKDEFFNSDPERIHPYGHFDTWIETIKNAMPSSCSNLSFCNANLPEEAIKKLNSAGVKEKAQQNMERYKYAQEKTGLPWQILAAIHYREGGMNPRSSLSNGTGLYVHRNSDGVMVSADANTDAEWAANHFITMAKSVYGVDVIAEPTAENYAQGFLAYNRGYMYKKAGNTPYTSSPYVMNYYDQAHLDMKWPASNAEPSSTRGKRDGNVGAMAVIAYLCDGSSQTTATATTDTTATTATTTKDTVPFSKAIAIPATTTPAKTIANTTTNGSSNSNSGHYVNTDKYGGSNYSHWTGSVTDVSKWDEFLSSQAEAIRNSAIKNNVPWEAMAAQAIIESGGGTSSLAKNCYNPLGLKGSPACDGRGHRRFSSFEEAYDYYFKHIIPIKKASGMFPSSPYSFLEYIQYGADAPYAQCSKSSYITNNEYGCGGHSLGDPTPTYVGTTSAIVAGIQKWAIDHKIPISTETFENFESSYITNRPEGTVPADATVNEGSSEEGSDYCATGQCFTGDLHSSSVDFPCDPHTTDAGTAEGYYKGQAYPIRLCSLDQPGYQIAIAGSYAKVNSVASAAFAGLANRYYTEKGTAMPAQSSFRSMADQQRMMAKYGSARAARPGYSNHQGGLAVDFTTGCGFGNGPSSCTTPMSLWLGKNIGDFGLSRPVRTEAWHVEPDRNTEVSSNCNGSNVDTAISEGGLTYEQAKQFMMHYGTNKNNSSSNFVPPGTWKYPTCNGGGGSNCTAFSTFFLNKFTSVPARGGNGNAIVGNLTGVEKGTTPKVWSVFSVTRNHTGIILGYHDGEWIVGHASCGNHGSGTGDGTKPGGGAGFVVKNANISIATIESGNPQYAYLADKIDFSKLQNYLKTGE